MKRIISPLFLLLCTSILFWSCERSNYPTDLSSSDQAGKAPQTTANGAGVATPSTVVFPQSVVLAGFTVNYAGRTLANNQTTFSYTVTGPAVQIAFRLELPGCAPALVAWDPTTGKQSSNDADINPGIEWSPSVGSGTTSTYTFSITYPGTVREGIIQAKVKSTSSSAVGFITGACARIFDISGSVFTDGNSNSLRDGAETGILGVTVNLYDAFNAPLQSTTSDGNGNYIFSDYPAGNYIVSVDTSTVAGTKTTYLSTTTPTTYYVTVGPNSTNNNFGFSPKTDKLVNDLKFGTLPTNGLTSGFWKKQLQSAVNGSGSPTVSKDSLLVYIARIRSLLLTEPFQLGTGDGLAEALNILSKPVKTDLDALTQQLLALEFNHVSGHGIVTTDASLQLTLIGWGESLVANAAASAAVSAPTAFATASSATDVYSGINKSSGGGGF
jgi:hypothetical protein